MSETTKKLRVFTDDCDTFIGTDLEDALKAMRDGGFGDLDPECVGEVGPSETITIHCDPKGDPATPGDPGVAPLTKTAAEWAQRGRGFLCTTEY